MDEAAFKINSSVDTKSSEAHKHDKIKGNVLTGNEVRNRVSCYLTPNKKSQMSISVGCTP